MMTRYLRMAILLLMIAACAAPAQADWLGDFLQSIARDTKRRNCWPKPFTRTDRQAVGSPFAIMVSNGWRDQNLLGDHYFSTEDGAELTEAGTLRVRWICARAPRQHRTIYVHRLIDPAVTAQRVANIQAITAEYAFMGSVPPVIETMHVAPGWPAERINAIVDSQRSGKATPYMPFLQKESDGGASP